MKLKAPRGTQDILPDRSPAWIWVESAFRRVLERYGYGELRTPIFEATELFSRGVGEATDIVQKEMYTFTDRKGRSLTLRPEGTAAAARAVLQHNLLERAPVKLYYIGPMFRYERPQAGRYRQHQQVGAEVFGADGPEADFEVITLLVDMMRAIGLTGLAVKLNSVGDGECRPAYTRALRDFLQQHDQALSPDLKRQAAMNPLRALDSKDPQVQEVMAGAPLIQDFLNAACRRHQDVLMGLLQRAGVTVDLDPRLVRGLDYYTRTVFEVQHGGLGAQSAVGGGGRYDRLVEEVGGPATPAVGFSTGLERMLLALEAEGGSVPGPASPQVTVVVAGETVAPAQLLARRLRERFRTAVDLMGRGLGGQMRWAGKENSSLVIVVGEDELAQQVWTVKTMATGEQERVADSELETYLASRLEEDV